MSGIVIPETKTMMADTAHRPWPMPRSPWVMRMCWHDLLFMHWPVAAESLRPMIPPELGIDTRDGTAWIAVVPFRMTGVTPRFVPALPYLSAFPELNVRTYVTAGGKPGVWFFSLEAARLLAVKVARWMFLLPYFHARMSCVEKDGWIHYESRRVHRGAPDARFAARYRPLGDVYRAEPGSLESWLIERYCLYAAGRGGGVRRGEIHHRPWALQHAEAVVEANAMVAAMGLPSVDETPLLHFARRLDVVVWRIHHLESPSGADA